MDEVEWLKSRLEHLETAILAQGPGRVESLGRPISRRGRSAKDTQASDARAQDYLSARDVADEGAAEPQSTALEAAHEAPWIHDELTGPGGVSAGGNALDLDNPAASDRMQSSLEAASDSEEASNQGSRE